MKSKPIVMNHFSTVHTSYIVNFDFTNNITILTGSSGTGKTASFSFMRECMAVNPDIVCINYQDYQKDIKKLVSTLIAFLRVLLLFLTAEAFTVYLSVDFKVTF